MLQNVSYYSTRLIGLGLLGYASYKLLKNKSSKLF